MRSSSRASAKLDLPEPLRPTTRVRPGPGVRSRVAFGPMPRKPSTVMAAEEGDSRGGGGARRCDCGSLAASARPRRLGVTRGRAFQEAWPARPGLRGRRGRGPTTRPRAWCRRRGASGRGRGGWCQALPLLLPLLGGSAPSRPSRPRPVTGDRDGDCIHHGRGRNGPAGACPASSVCLVPRISSFYGITIAMYFNDHAPPHFHVAYAGWEASFRLSDLAIIEGQVPSRPPGSFGCGPGCMPGNCLRTGRRLGPGCLWTPFQGWSRVRSWSGLVASRRWAASGCASR